MITIDMTLDRIAAALSGNYAGRPDLDALRGELRRLLDRAETGEQRGRITALEQMIENLEKRKAERRTLARRLADQAESAERIRVLEAALERILAINGSTGGAMAMVLEFKHIARTALARKVPQC